MVLDSPIAHEFTKPVFVRWAQPRKVADLPAAADTAVRRFHGRLSLSRGGRGGANELGSANRARSVAFSSHATGRHTRSRFWLPEKPQSVTLL